MDNPSHALAPIKSALFVDFDNIYIGLSKTDPLAAERFASDPARWLSWLERGGPGTPDALASRNGDQQARRRTVLIRRCYPNPDAGFRRYRSYFTSSAFSVIDCPTLTRTGKNSSDIYMVMDILDTLNHKTYFDEFIIFSGDSDFMPVLLRLRAHDRRTTTLAIDFMPPAYKASCDLVINEEEFIVEALGVSPDSSNSNSFRSRLGLPILKEMAQRVLEEVRQQGEVPGAELPDILKDFRDFRESSNWLGFGTSHRLAEALICQESRLNLVRLNPIQYKLALKSDVALEEGPQPVIEIPSTEVKSDDGHVLEPVLQNDAAAKPLNGNGNSSYRSEPGKEAHSGDHVSLRHRIVTAVREVVAESRNAVLLARASQFVVSKVGPEVLESQWAGAGSFKKLLQSVEDLGLEITTLPEPGYIFDPQRHVHPVHRAPRASTTDAVHSGEPQDESSGENLPENSHFETASEYDESDHSANYEETLPSLEEFAHRVSRVTGAPLLTSEQYALVFRGVIQELERISQGQKVYNTYQSSKSVSDWCAEQGHAVSHSDIVLVFKGIIFQDSVRFGKQPGSYTAFELAMVVRDNIKVTVPARAPGIE